MKGDERQRGGHGAFIPLLDPHSTPLISTAFFFVSPHVKTSLVKFGSHDNSRGTFVPHIDSPILWGNCL